MTEAALVEGQWKSRWLVLRKPSPVAVHRFHVTVAPGTKLESGPATLHLCNDVLVVARDVPPAVTGQWKLSDLRRYGAVPNGFIFEGGTRCGYWAGVFFLSSAEGEQISFLFDCIVRGLSPTKGPCGLRPVLPDPGPGGPAEERGAQEALEALQLEKRLSLLSHCGRPGSGGDDRSLSSSSSEASHSDVSASGRLTAWPEQSSSSASTSQEGPGLGVARAPGEAVLGASRPPKPLRPRQLQEVGRQGSSDSGIATGSHSSYSGSFSSFAGSSLDVWHAGDEFGSLLSLPPAAGAPEPSLCACPPGTAEYQVPSALRPHYDTPRSLRQEPRDQTPAVQGGLDASAAGDSGGQTSAACPSSWLGARRRAQGTEALGSEAPPSPAPGEPREAGGPHAGAPPAFFSACPVCGGLKGAAAAPPGLPVHPAPLPAGAPGPEGPSSEAPAYVNIPTSPPSKQQLHYLGLELGEAGAGVRGVSPPKPTGRGAAGGLDFPWPAVLPPSHPVLPNAGLCPPQSFLLGPTKWTMWVEPPGQTPCPG
ncbi:protein Dok-7 isoform X7 [Pteropus medius]|uniref:protein Dok-7 isoform X7 n=1 Tax=Pteropus vampyrus TaxID=132908 RepID=UPI00196A3D43|nr:protein Dok-7 isoform X7 [Pteropus giganteus]